MKYKVSVLIPTKNEEDNLEECIKSVLWADEIIVFDSYSIDNTIQIAQNFGAKIIQRKFNNFSSHKNWALRNIKFQNSWLLLLDGDERVDDKLFKEITTILQNPKADGYYIARKNYFMGKWMKYGGWYPDWALRLFKHNLAYYEERIVHERLIINGKVGYLNNPIIHLDFKGLERYFDRHNTYSSLEAIEAYNTISKPRREYSLKQVIFKNGPELRWALKEIGYKYIPCRSLLKFVWMYFFRLGFMNGRIGFRFCILHSFYEYQISLKLEELKNSNSAFYKKYKNYIQG